MSRQPRQTGSMSQNGRIRPPKPLFEKVRRAFRCISSNPALSKFEKRTQLRNRFPCGSTSEGAAVGEMSPLTGKPRTATVTTVVPTILFTLTRADFRNLPNATSRNLLALPGFCRKTRRCTKQVGIEYVNCSRASLTSEWWECFPSLFACCIRLFPLHT